MRLSSTTRGSWLASLAMILIAGCTVDTIPGIDGGRDGGTDAYVPEDDAGRDAGPPPCEPGEIDCSGTCTRVAGDPLNCGSCGVVCPAGVGCAAGRCDCELPRVSCDGICLDPSEDPFNCGTCFNECDSIDMCSAGECIVACTAPDRVCVNRDGEGTPRQVCADLQTDPINCGACNTRCAGGSVCTDGRCQCPSGQLNCGGTCREIATDVANCGSCRISCGSDGTCADGRCTECGTGLTDCSGRCVDVMTDRFNCGSCARGCGSGEACVGGLCECATGLLDCGTGCTDLMTDVDNCGTCGTDCGPGGVCSAGTCTCATGLTMCSGSCRDLTTDLANCGACDMVCPALTGGVCAGGTCGCPGALAECGGACVDTQTDRAHCGVCDAACPAGFVCLMGACTDAPPTRYMQTTPAPGTVSFIDACAAPGSTVILADADDQSERVPLPFAFRYWATDLPVGSQINISSNSFLSMDGVASAAYFGVAVPSTDTPNAVIAPYWRDTVTRTTGICVATVGSAPNRQWVVEWNDAFVFYDTTTNLTFEVILTEGSNTIDLVYETLTGATTAAVGIEDQTGAMGVNACPGGTGGCVPTAGQRIRFVPIP